MKVIKNVLWLCLCSVVVFTSCGSFEKKETRRLTKMGRNLIKTQQGDENSESYTYSYDSKGIYCDNYTEGWSMQILSFAEVYPILEPMINWYSQSVEARLSESTKFVFVNDFRDYDVIVYDSHNIFVADNGSNKRVAETYIQYSTAYYVLLRNNKPIQFIPLYDFVVNKDINKTNEGRCFAKFSGSLMTLYAYDNLTFPLQKLRDRIGNGAYNEWSYCFVNEDFSLLTIPWNDPYRFSIEMKFTPFRPGLDLSWPINPSATTVCFDNVNEPKCLFKDIVNNTITENALSTMKSKLDDEFTSYIHKHSLDYQDILNDYDKNQVKAAAKYEGKDFFIKLPVKRFWYNNTSKGLLKLDVDVNHFHYDYITDIILYSNDESFAELTYPSYVYVWAEIKNVDEEYTFFAHNRYLIMENAYLFLWETL